MGDFINMHQHSIYSIRDSIAKIDELILRAVELKMSAIGLTDHGTMGGIPSFYKEATEHEIKPLLGCEVYMSTRSRTQKEKGIDKYYHLTLLAMNNTGWHNLSTLVSEGYQPDNFYYKPRIDRELLRKYNEGLICLSGCMGANLANSILREQHIDYIDDEGNHETAECCDSHLDDGDKILYETPDEVVEWHKKVFGDRYYLEVQNHNTPKDTVVNNRIYELSKKYNIKTIATGDTHFVNKDDVTAHDIMIAIRGGFSIHDDKMNDLKYPGNGYELLSYDEMVSRFPNNKESVENTAEIADRCNVKFNLNNLKLPHVVDLKDEDEIFRTKVMEGLKKRFGTILSPEVITRAEEEIDTIIQMTYPSYFLLVSDYIKWCRNNNIPIGPGRGSAAGSIVSYALEITDVNPLDYGLSFSRFLNKGRAAIPIVDFKEYPYAEWQLKQQSRRL